MCQRSWSSSRLAEDPGPGFIESLSYFSGSPRLCWSPSNLVLGPINLTSPRSLLKGEWAAHSPLLFSFFIFRQRGSTREGRDRGSSGWIWFNALWKHVCFQRLGGGSTTQLSVTTSSITLTLTGTLHQSQFPGPPSGISHYHLQRGNLLKYKYVLWWVCYACQLKDIFSYISYKLRCMLLACLNPGKCQMW